MRIAVLCVAVVLAAGVRAEEDPAERIRTLSRQAQVEYDLGHYQVALQHSEELYKLKPVPGVLFNVAQCHRQLGHLKEAARLYRSFLNHADPASTEAVKAQDLLAQVEAALKQQEAAVHAAPQGTSPLMATPAEPPRAVPQAALPRAPEPSPPSHKTAYVLGGTALAALAAGAAFGIASKSAANELTSSVHSNADANALADKHDSAAHIADLLFALGGALALATVIAW